MTAYLLKSYIRAALRRLTYTYLGNGINHDLCLRFVGEMDFNLNKLKRAIAQGDGK